MGRSFETEGVASLQRRLDSLVTTNPEMRKHIQDAIRSALKEVRKRLSQDAKTGLQMDSDPRHAYKAVRYAVYKRILGGQVNILQKRKAGSPTNYQKARKGLPKRGGNRWGRSERTKSLEGYEGTDRGFVLRFLNEGTSDRMIHSFAGKDGKSNVLRTGNTMNIKYKNLGGNRGNIKARNWFGGASQKQLENAALNIQNIIDDILLEKFVY